MPVINADAGLKTRFVLLLAGLWAFVAVVSQLFVQVVIGLSDDSAMAFLVVHWLGALVFGGLTVLGTLRQLAPLFSFASIEASGTRLEASALDQAIGALPRLTVRLGLMGMVAPVLWMLCSGLVLANRDASPVGGLELFLVLGLFDGTFVGAILFVLAGTWLAGLVERLAGYRGQALSAPGVALRWKISLLGFLLATVPTLLVGSMSYHTAIRLLGEEVGVQLGQRLLKLEGEVGGLLTAGAARDAIEAQLSLEAERLGPQTFIHMGREDGTFYRSSGAEPLSPEVYARVRAAQAPGSAGLIREGSESYAYAYSADGATVSIAPVRRASLQQTGATMLWLIFGITLCSMVVAALIGFTFASNLGHKLKRMTQMTEEVARGDLTRDARVYSDDEIGLLGASLHTMSENLRRMVRNVSALANQIAGTCSQLLVKASAISTGAEIQSRSVGEVSSSIEELDENIQEASNNLQALADAAQEAAEAVNKVGEGFNRMLTEMGGLQSTVERTGTIVERMAKSVAEVAGTIKDLSSGAERSALSMSEMDRSISAVTTSAADTAQIAQRAIDVAQEGAVAVRRTIEGMDRIVSSTRQASDVIVGLGNRIEAIGSILGVIEEIADQTNLLALNAAIIAAQAGEHGRSFAVVADEIRSLAERTGASTREIAQMISDIQAASEEAIAVMKGGGTIVNEGVNLAKQAGESLSLILVNVQKATENVQGIAANTEGQARASASVTREIGRVAEMALRISQSAGQQETAAEELRTAFTGTLNTSQSLGRLVSQQAQENRQAMAAVTSMNEAASRANQAVIGQSAVSEGILRSIEQVREIGKNHAGAAAEMGGATQSMAEKSGRLKQEIEEFKV